MALAVCVISTTKFMKTGLLVYWVIPNGAIFVSLLRNMIPAFPPFLSLSSSLFEREQTTSTQQQQAVPTSIVRRVEELVAEDAAERPPEAVCALLLSPWVNWSAQPRVRLNT